MDLTEPNTCAWSLSVAIPLDVIGSVMEHCDFFTLAILPSLSRAAYRLVAHCLRDRYRASVRPFVRDIDLFNALLRRYGGIISGSVALHFLFPDARWEPNDLELYLPEGQINAFMKAVTDKDGLNFSPFNPKWVLGDPDELLGLLPNTESVGDAVHEVHDGTGEGVGLGIGDLE
ncbi:hypothetical protein L227DRAFT_615909, partial [Lentinus tigrinus ALCF2SS1-6]